MILLSSDVLTKPMWIQRSCNSCLLVSLVSALSANSENFKAFYRKALSLKSLRKYQLALSACLNGKECAVRLGNLKEVCFISFFWYDFLWIIETQLNEVGWWRLFTFFIYLKNSEFIRYFFNPTLAWSLFDLPLLIYIKTFGWLTLSTLDQRFLLLIVNLLSKETMKLPFTFD
jgi:hypothetical protein